MVTLLLDSSNTSLTVGIAKDDELLGFTSYEAWQQQSEFMVPEIAKLMENLHVNRQDLTNIVVSIGPGSYTGVRIVLTIAKTISLACSIPIYPVSSLRVLKDNEKPSICVINARSNRSYFGVFEGENILVGGTIKTNDEVKEYISSHLDYSICGDARYLGYDNKDTNICKQMMSLLPHLQKAENDLSVKPVYMKD